MEQQVEEFRQLAFISGLLAGFSISISYQLLSSESTSRLTGALIGVQLLVSISLIVSTITSVFVVLSSSGGIEPSPDNLDSIRKVASITKYLIFTGLVLFLVGFGISGWLRSKTLGWFSTILSLVGVIVIVYAKLKTS